VIIDVITANLFRKTHLSARADQRRDGRRSRSQIVLVGSMDTVGFAGASP